MAFNNSGSVRVESGTLSLSGGGTSSGSFAVAAGARLVLANEALASTSSVSGAGAVSLSTLTMAGTYNVTGSTTVNGLVDFSGTVTTVGSPLVVNGTANFHGTPLSLTNLTVSGTLQDSAAVGVSGTLDWPAGTIAGGGTVTVAAGGTLTIRGTDYHILTGGATLTNLGTGTWQDYPIALNGGSVFNNAGTLTVAGPYWVQTNGGGVVNNSGTWIEAAGPGGGTDIQGGVAFNNSGSVQVQSGTLYMSGAVSQLSGTILTGGTWSVAGSGTLNLPGSNLTTIGSGASVTLNGAASSFAKINSLITNQGTFNLQNGRTFITSADFSNTGTVSIDATSKLQTALAGQVGEWAGEGNASDSVGGNTGTLQGGTAFAAGRIGQAFSLDGVDDWISSNQQFATDQSHTISAWVYWKGQNGQTWQEIVSWWNQTDPVPNRMFPGTTGTTCRSPCRREAGCIWPPLMTGPPTTGRCT